MKYILGWFLVIIGALGWLLFIIGTLDVAFRIDYSLGIALFGVYLWYSSVKLLNRNKL